MFPPLVAIPLDNIHFWNISWTSDSLVTFRRLINIHSLTLNAGIEMVKLLKKACQSQDGPETRPLPPNSQVVKAKEMFLKEIKSAPPVNTQRRR